ncbi:hypothetical protein NL676_034997 [Syzygium grande]|nr:hypothetical protein NL676_034997 [Syzygium grande]
MGGLDTGQRGHHEGDNDGLDLLLLGVGDRGRGGVMRSSLRLQRMDGACGGAKQEAQAAEVVLKLTAARWIRRRWRACWTEGRQ